MARWVKDPVLSLLWLKFDPWPWNLYMLWVKKIKKGREEGRKGGREEGRKEGKEEGKEKENLKVNLPKY